MEKLNNVVDKLSPLDLRHHRFLSLMPNVFDHELVFMKKDVPKNINDSVTQFSNRPTFLIGNRFRDDEINKATCSRAYQRQ